MCVYVYVHIHMNTHTHIHTNTRTYIYKYDHCLLQTKIPQCYGGKETQEDGRTGGVWFNAKFRDSMPIDTNFC